MRMQALDLSLRTHLGSIAMDLSELSHGQTSKLKNNNFLKK